MTQGDSKIWPILKRKQVKMVNKMA